jgi:hypothetical protein
VLSGRTGKSLTLTVRPSLFDFKFVDFIEFQTENTDVFFRDLKTDFILNVVASLFVALLLEAFKFAYRHNTILYIYLYTLEKWRCAIKHIRFLARQLILATQFTKRWVDSTCRTSIRTLLKAFPISLLTARIPFSSPLKHSIITVVITTSTVLIVFFGADRRVMSPSVHVSEIAGQTEDQLRTLNESTAVPSIWPVEGRVVLNVGAIRRMGGGDYPEFHKGMDIEAAVGTPVQSAASGTVIIADYRGEYGNFVCIDHGNGLSTRYGHLARIDVALGQTIKRGDHLGLVGSTGRSTSPNLHYEVRVNNQPVNPRAYLPPA